MTLSRVTPPVALLVSLLLAIGLVLATLPSTTAAPFDPRTAIGPLAEPADWMNSARGLPDGRAYAAALDAAGEVEALTAEVDPALAAAEWTLMGPTNIGGRVTDLAVDPAKLEDPSEVADLLAAHPSLMQRPVAILGDRAVVARPSERILKLLDD